MLHTKVLIATKWTLRQNSVNYDKTAYIVNFSCGAITNSSTLQIANAPHILPIQTEFGLTTGTHSWYLSFCQRRHHFQLIPDLWNQNTQNSGFSITNKSSWINIVILDELKTTDVTAHDDELNTWFDLKATAWSWYAVSDHEE